VTKRNTSDGIVFQVGNTNANSREALLKEGGGNEIYAHVCNVD